jgi:DNA polymerase-3 subunit beta
MNAAVKYQLDTLFQSATINLNPLALLAASQCAAEKDVRFYLNGVYVDVKSSTAFIVGCDGHMIGVFKQYAGDVPDFSVIIPLEVIKKIDKKANTVELSYEEDKDRWSLSGIRFVPVDGRYPDWRKVADTNVDETPHKTQINPELTARAAKAFKVFYGSKVIPDTLSCQNGLAVIMHVGDNNSMVKIMGIRADHHPKYIAMKL